LTRTTISVEESKNRRIEGETKRENRLAPVRQPDTTEASAATRFARQGVRELQRQAALDRELCVFTVPGLPVGRPEAGAADAHDSFVSSFLRTFGVKARGQRSSVSVDGFDYGRP
jgi:hypothetical protein